MLFNLLRMVTTYHYVTLLGTHVTTSIWHDLNLPALDTQRPQHTIAGAAYRQATDEFETQGLAPQRSIVERLGNWHIASMFIPLEHQVITLGSGLGGKIKGRVSFKFPVTSSCVGHNAYTLKKVWKGVKMYWNPPPSAHINPTALELRTNLRLNW